MKQNHCRLLLLAVLVVLSHFSSYSQVSGYIYDQDGSPLPFATVLIEGGSTGTSANLEGYFELTLPAEGSYTLIFSYVGFISQKITVQFDGKPIHLTPNLIAAYIAIQEFVYDGNAEDPAYGIIREVQKKRIFYRDESPAFSCNSYVKGLIKVDSTPAKVLGVSFDELFEDERSKVLYLSETESTLMSNGGNTFKEIIHASVVSGEDQGLSFNSAQEMDFNLYENFYEMPRPLLSPIGKKALSFYRYKLRRSYFDELDRKIYEIDVWPKRADDPCYTGKIFIYDETWDLHSSELGVNGTQCYQEGLDSMIVQQQYIDIEGTVHKFPVSRRVFFNGGMFGIQFSGNFNVVYSDYVLSSKKYEELGDKEQFVYEAAAIEKSKEYFDSIRPIPLNTFELVDYSYKDSLLQLEKNPAYRDSLDKSSNKFELNNLLIGYRYRRSSKNLYISIPSPFESILYNTVQGRNITLSARVNKFNSKKRTKWLQLFGELNYGFAEQKLRSSASIRYKFNSISSDLLGIGFGSSLTDYNNHALVSPFIASLTALYFHNNPVKLYERTFAELWFQRAIGIQLSLRLFTSLERRTVLNNSSDFYYFYPERSFTDNYPTDINVDPSSLSSEVFKAGFEMKFYPGRSFQTYPGRRVYIQSKWPVFTAGTTALVNDESINFKWSFACSFSDMPIGNWGSSRIYTELRGFVNPSNVNWIDRHHFRGNPIGFNSSEHLDKGFFLLPYYRFSTVSTNVTGVWAHNFEGKITNRIPVLRRMNVSLVLRAAYMNSGDSYYSEFSVGLDRLGFKLWKGGRIDYVVKTFSNAADIPASGLKFSFSL